MYKIFFIISCYILSAPQYNFKIDNNINLAQSNTQFTQDITHLVNKAHDCLEESKNEYANMVQQLLQYVLNNKKKCLFSSLICSYAAIIATLWFLQSKINKGHWKTWKSEICLENLFAIKQQDLAQQLLLDIQLHYINPACPTDTTEPISKFLIDIAQEEASIQKYLNLIESLERLRIVRFIYFKMEKTKYEEYAKRIHCLKSLFTLWLSEYKVSLLHEQKQPSSAIA